jgi:hypothetical protein
VLNTGNDPYLRYPTLYGDLVGFVAQDDVWHAPLEGGRPRRPKETGRLKDQYRALGRPHTQLADASLHTAQYPPVSLPPLQAVIEVVPSRAPKTVPEGP